MSNIVIGSGPAGISAATALLARGRDVLMIDAGKTLEAEKAEGWRSLGARQPEDWGAEERAAAQAGQFSAPPGQARRFGSDFAMEAEAATFAENANGLGLRASRALGGFSNIWGAAVLPYRAADLTGWPVGAGDLAPHYKAVSEFLPVTRPAPPAADWLGYPGLKGAEPVPAGRQIACLLERLEKAAPEANVRVFPAQQAVAGGCRQCGLCLHGCPWGLIWSAGAHVEKLQGHDCFSYRPGAVAQNFSQGKDSASVTLESGEMLTANRVFIATGVLETARLVFASTTLGSLTLRDSSFGFLPMLHRWRVSPAPDRLPYSTLPQAFATLDAAALSPYLINAQLYGWNEFFAHDLITNYARLLPGSAPFWRMLARRLIAAQIFLHSDHSHVIDLRPAADGRLAAQAVLNPGTWQLLGKAASAYARHFRKAGLYALKPAMRKGQIGASFHLGGSLPMSKAPQGCQTDPLGRLAGLDRVHVVDASVLPSIAATTITFTVMANAHRIASAAP